MLSEKDIIRSNKDLIELHKRCLITHFTQGSVKVKTRRKFFKLYDIYIKHSNIRNYFFRELDLFILALVKDRLEDIADYTERTPTKKKRKKNVHR